MTLHKDNKQISENTESACFSQENHDQEIEKKWIAESEARYDAYKRGEIPATDWEVMQKRYNS